MTKFRGFPAEALGFFAGLEADNSKSYWTEHRAVYDEAVRAPMVALVESLASEFGSFSIFRPHRDVRFSKDKSPYKTNIGAAGETAAGASVYIALNAEGLYAGTGYYRFAKDQLARYRDAVDDEKTGAKLETAVGKLRKARYGVSGESLKVAPRGYPRDHPRVGLLRHGGLYAGKQFPIASWLHTAACRVRILNTWRGASELTAWLDEHVGPSTMPPEAWG